MTMPTGACRQLAACLIVVSVAGTVKAAEPAPAVVELFTSQGCYSCPPAEAYLGQLAGRGDIIALEYHIDYWDDLVYGSAGKWKDPFSSPHHTQRQRAYNVQIRGTANVYTPQMVIGGVLEAVGSRTARVESAIARLRHGAAPPLTVKVTATSADRLVIRIDGSAPPANVWLVGFHETVETKVRAGENKGKTLTSHNIVTEVSRIGAWAGAPLSLDAQAPAAGRGCAVLVQQTPSSPILGASYCPAGARS